MKIDSFRELLLKKAEGNDNLQYLIKNTHEDFLSEKVMESLMKMAEDKRRPRSSNSVIKHFGDMHLDDHMTSMVHDALGHHASHYKAAVNSGNTGPGSVAAQHMKQIHNVMHLSRKLSKDSVGDHSGGMLNIEAVDPKPWERQAYLKPGKSGALSDTKGWSRTHPSYEYMQGRPSKEGSYGKETDRHGHKGPYPLEEMKVNGKHLHIDDNVDASKYAEHEFTDHHPIFKPVEKGNKTPAYKMPASKLNDDHYDIYDNAVEDYEDAGHRDTWDERHSKMRQEDPEGYANRGTTKPDPVHAPLPDAPEEAAPEASEAEAKPKVDIHQALTSAGVDLDSLPDDVKEKLGLKKSLARIRELLIKNKDFLLENPEILAGVEERLLKADPDDAESWLKENDPSFSEDDFTDEDGATDEGETDYGNEDLMGLFDSPEEADDHYADEDKELVTSESGEPEYVDIDADEKPAAVEEAPKEKPEKRKSGYAEWKPRKDYTPKQQEKIKEFTDEGYHPGDAEILAGAHRKHASMDQAVKNTTHPHDMSDLMHDRLRGIADKHMSNVVSGEYKYADAKMNPQMATAGAAADKHKEVTKDFRTEKEKLFNSSEYKKMDPSQQRVAFKEFRRAWKDKVPEHRENMREAWKHHGSTHKENWDKRQDNLIEGMRSIVGAGQADTESGGSISEGSRKMAEGQEGDMGTTSQGAYQSAGGVTEGEQSTGASSIKDPYATFAEKIPEKLKAKYAEKLKQLSPERQGRLSRLKGFKGDE